MRVVVELYKEVFGGKLKTFFEIKLYKDGQILTKREIVYDNMMKSMFDIIFDKAKEEIRESINAK